MEKREIFVEPGELPISDAEVVPSETGSAVSEDVVNTDSSVIEDSVSVDDEFGLSCEEKVMTLLAALKEEFREPIENLSCVKNSDNDMRCEMMQKLLSSIFDNVCCIFFSAVAQFMVRKLKNTKLISYYSHADIFYKLFC